MNDELLKVFPNPAKDVVYIVTPTTANASCTVFNQLGAAVERFGFTHSPYTIDLSDYEAGTYTIMVRDHGGKTYHSKLIKQ